MHHMGVMWDIQEPLWLAVPCTREELWFPAPQLACVCFWTRLLSLSLTLVEFIYSCVCVTGQLFGLLSCIPGSDWITICFSFFLLRTCLDHSQPVAMTTLHAEWEKSDPRECVLWGSVLWAEPLCGPGGNTLESFWMLAAVCSFLVERWVWALWQCE